MENTLPSKSGNPKRFKKIITYLTRIFQGRSTRCFIYVFVSQVISEEHCTKDFTRNLKGIFI